MRYFQLMIIGKTPHMDIRSFFFFENIEFLFLVSDGSQWLYFSALLIRLSWSSGSYFTLFDLNFILILSWTRFIIIHSIIDFKNDKFKDFAKVNLFNGARYKKVGQTQVCKSPDRKNWINYQPLNILLLLK